MHLCSAFKALENGTKSWCFLLHGHGGAHRFYVDTLAVSSTTTTGEQ